MLEALKLAGSDGKIKIIALLKTGEMARRRAAVEVLKEIGMRHALPTLNELAATNDADLAPQAKVAIDAISIRPQ